MKKWLGFCLVALVISLVVVMACGSMPEPIAENVNVRETRLTTWVYRTVDVEAGVVCYHGDKWGQCFLLDDTRLDW